MALIEDINPATPNDDPDEVAGGAAQFRQLKTDVLGSFGNLGSNAVTKTALEINALITADSTETLTNKTIEDGTYTGTQSGFVGDVDGDITGNAATVTTNANLTGDVTSVGNTTTIAPGSVNSGKVEDNSLTLSNDINKPEQDTFVASSPSGELVPSGIWNIGQSTTTIASTTVTVEIWTGTSWRPAQTINHTGGGTVPIDKQYVSDGLSLRVLNSNSLQFNARRVYT